MLAKINLLELAVSTSSTLFTVTATGQQLSKESVVNSQGTGVKWALGVKNGQRPGVSKGPEV